MVRRSKRIQEKKEKKEISPKTKPHKELIAKQDANITKSKSDTKLPLFALPQIPKTSPKGTLTESKINLLNSIYYDLNQSSSFSSAIRIYKYLKSKGYDNISLSNVQHYLNQQKSYLIFKQRQDLKRFASYKLYFPFQLLEADLMSLFKYKDSNKGVLYVLICVDAFSKRMFVRGLKDKMGQTVSKAFKDILDQIGKGVYCTITDLGSEFKSKYWKKICKDYSIIHKFSTTGHCHIVERHIRTLHTLIARYMEAYNTENYIDALQQICHNYNSRIHSATNFPPSKVDNTNQYEIYKYMKKNTTTYDRKQYRFKIGEKVYISYSKSVFDKEDKARYSFEVYTISKRYRSHNNVNMYKIADTKEELFGTFMEPELTNAH